MKNLIIKTLGIAGIMALNFLPVKSLKGQEKDSLLLYNLENKQLYHDFVEFLKERKDEDGFYYNKIKNTMIQIPRNDLVELMEGYIIINHYLPSYENQKRIRIHDFGFNGLDSLDYFQQGSYKEEFIKDVSLKRKLEIAKQYSTTLKQILHKEKYKNY